MARFKNGVSYYTMAKAEIKMGFPEGQVCCHWCDFCKPEPALDRFRCMHSWRMIYDPFWMGLPEGCIWTIVNDFENKNIKMEVETDDVDSE